MNILYSDLPGIYAEIVDGNIHPPVMGMNNVIGIFGTASAGPSLYPLRVGDYANITNGFGTKGTVIDAYFEALLGKPENVVVTRIGSKPVKIFLGKDTTIETLEHGDQAAANYGVFLDKTNKILRVYLLKDTGNLMVWSNAPSELDDIAGMAYVDVILGNNLFTDISSDIGSLSTPLSFSAIIDNPTADYCGVPGSTGADGPLTNKDLYEAMLQGFLATESVNIDQIVVPGAYLDTPTLADDIVEQENTISLDHTLTPGDGDVYTVNIDNEAYTVTGDGSTTGADLFDTLASSINESSKVDAFYNASNDLLTITATTNGVPVVITATVTIGGSTSDITVTIVKDFSDNIYISSKLNDTMAPVDDSTGSCRIFKFTNKYMIKETVEVSVAGSPADPQPTLIMHDGTLYAIFDTEVSDTVTVDYYAVENDALPFVTWTQENGEIVVSWSPFPTSIHSEANFAWEIARAAYELSANDNECLGVVGVRPPNSFTPRDLSRWVGTEPVYDVNGNIITEGTGLLGNKFMVGNNNGGPGFYATDTRKINGLPLTDSNGHKLDLGRFIAVVTGYGLISAGNPQKSARYVGSPEAVFAAFDQMLEPNEAATNKTLPGIKIPYRLTKKQLNSLTKWNYTVVANEQITGRTYVVSSPTAAASDSDYQQRQTMKITIALINDFREICKPFIGNAFSPRIMQAQKALLKERYAIRQSQNYVEWIDIELKASPIDRILGKETAYLKFMPASELRQIFLYSSLSITK